VDQPGKDVTCQATHEACNLPGCPHATTQRASPLQALSTRDPCSSSYPCVPLTGLPDHFLRATARDSEQHSVKLLVPHVHQSHNWDCGLACVLMVMQAFNVFTYDLAVLCQICETKSIWTIDLAHLLRFFGFEVIFLTVTIGANPDYASETFYRDHIGKDEERVDRLFNEAVEKGISLHKLSLTADRLRSLVLTGQYLAVVLIDKRKLNAAIMRSRVLCSVQIPVMVASYTGHYVVICGFDAVNKDYIICDPASTSGPMTVSAEVLEEARKSYGTDEDILFVSHKLHRCQTSSLPTDSSYRTRSHARRHRRHAACGCLSVCCCCGGGSSQVVIPHISSSGGRQPVAPADTGDASSASENRQAVAAGNPCPSDLHETPQGQLML